MKKKKRKKKQKPGDGKGLAYNRAGDFTPA